MIYIDNTQTNPYFNIAAEQHILHNSTDDCIMLYINDPSIILGKHQNTLAEINYTHTQQHNIPVIRRLSGGGTVYHDKGNLNFMFVSRGETGKLIQFRKYIEPINNMLNDNNILSVINHRNDILLNGKKISGNAEHIHKNRTLHHGTLLYSADLSQLGAAIAVREGEYADRAIKSFRSAVTSICNEVQMSIDIRQFREKLADYLCQYFDIQQRRQFTQTDLDEITKLIDEKYNTWEWNYGYSPAYEIQRSFLLDKEKLDLTIKVRRGRITEATVAQTSNAAQQIKEILTNSLHHETELRQKLQQICNAQQAKEIAREIM